MVAADQPAAADGVVASMDLQQILAALLNPNGSQQAMPQMAGAPAQVGDHANPALLQQQRLAQPPQMQPQQQAMPPQAPQGQPMPQSAPQAAPQPQGGGLGGLGGILQNIIAPQSAQKNQTVGWLTSQGLDPGTATVLASDKGALRQFIMQRSQGQKPIEIAGKLVDPVTFKVIADFSAPANRQTTTIDGKLVDTNTGKVIGDYGSGGKATAAQQDYEYAMRQLRERGVPEDKLPTFQEFSKPKSRGISFRGADGTEIQIGGEGDGTAYGGTSLPAEVGGRIGLGDNFIKSDYPEVIKMIENGDATGPIDYAAGVLGRGNSGIVQRRMASGADALRRGLTGAGMSASESEEYARRYLPKPTDDAATLKLKAEGLKADLEAVTSGAIKGKAGDVGGFLPSAPTPSEAPPKTYDGDPKLWQYMTPEQRKLWQ